jgi:hypothetical protein
MLVRDHFADQDLVRGWFTAKGPILVADQTSLTL